MLNSSDNMTFKPIRGVNMDVLSDILDKVQLTSSYWYRTSFAGDWGINLPKEDNFARFHIVTHGEFWLSRDPCGIDLIMPLPAPAKGCVASA